MSHSLETRLTLVERRLERLERAAGARPPPRAAKPPAYEAPRPVPPPPPLPSVRSGRPASQPARPDPVRPHPSAPTPPRAPADAATRSIAPTRPADPTMDAPRDWERFFGLAVLGRIGVAAVLLAAGYFARLAYTGMSPALKVVSIYALAAAFLAVGQVLRARAATRYVALLCGGGAAAAYLAGIVAHLKYDLVGDSAALGMLFAASALGQFLARTLRHQTLASMALAGAFAAPLITQSSLDNGTFLLVYLLVLHAWSAWVQRRWGWHSARIVGVAGTLLVGLHWLSLHGDLDVNTYVHVHLYLLGLLAPELYRLARGMRLPEPLQLGIPIALGGIQALLALVTVPAAIVGGERVLTGAPLLAGALWTAIAVALAPRGRAHGNGLFVRGLAHVGLTLLAFGGLIVSAGLPAGFALEPETVAVWATTAAAMVALALRKRLGVGDIAATIGVVLAGIAALVAREPEHVLSLLPVALAGAMTLIALAKHAPARVVASWSGLLTLACGVAAGTRFGAHDTTWIAAGFLAGTGWALGLMAFGRVRRGSELEVVGTLQLFVLALVWIPNAFSDLRAVTVPLVDPMTLAALAIAGAAAYAARRVKARTDEAATLPTMLWGLAILMPLLAGHREMLSAVEGLAVRARDGWHTLYATGAGVLLAWIARGRSVLGARAALALITIGLTKTIMDCGASGATPWAAAQLGSVLVAALAAAWLAAREDAGQVMGAFWILAGAALTWALYASVGRLPHEPAIFNLRFLLGLLVLVGLGAFPYGRLGEDARAGITSTALIGGVVLGFFVGHAEVWGLVRTLGEAWPDVLVSVYMVLYAAATLALGFRQHDTRLRYPALVLFALVVLKVGVHDLATASIALRIFVTGILGLVLLMAAYAYARLSSETAPKA